MILRVRVPYLSIKIWSQFQLLWQSQYWISEKCVQMSFQMWVQWRALPTTGPGTPCTGPAPPRPPSADTPWTKAEQAPLRGRPWSRCPRTTTHTWWPWMSVRSQSLFQLHNIWYGIQNMVPWLKASFPVFTSLQNFSRLLLTHSEWRADVVSAGKTMLQLLYVPSSCFTDWVFDGFFSPFIYSLTYMLIFCQGRPQRALSMPSIFCFYCNINADKWNWLPLDQRPALLPALKGSCFLLIPWMHFYLFKYHSARTVCLHEHTLTHQSLHFEALSDGSSFNGRLTQANVRTLSIVSASHKSKRCELIM